MRKNIKILLFSVVGLVVLGGTILILQLLKPDETAEPPNDDGIVESATVFTELSAEDVESIRIVNRTDDGYTIVSAQNGGFVISEFGETGVPYNQPLLESAATAVASLSSSSTVEENAEDLAKYGLSDNFTAKVEAKFTGGSSVTFIIGNDTPEARTVYFRLEDDNTVYAVSATTVGNFTRKRHYWIDKIAFPDYDYEKSPVISKLKIERADWDEPLIIEPIQEVALEEIRTFNQYKLTSPFRIELDSEKVQSVLHGIFGLAAKDVLDVAPVDETLEVAGINEPLCLVEVTAGDNIYTLKIGNTVSDEDGVSLGWFGESSHVPGILFLFDPVTLPWLFTSPEKLFSEMFLMPYIYSLERVEIEADNGDGDSKILDFGIFGDADDNHVSFNGVQLNEAEGERFKSFYEFLISAKGETLFLEEFESESESESAETVESAETARIAKVSYFYRDKSRSADVVEYYTTSDRKTIIRINDENVFKSRDLYTLRLVKNIEAFVSGDEIVLDW